MAFSTAPNNLFSSMLTNPTALTGFVTVTSDLPTATTDPGNAAISSYMSSLEAGNPTTTSGPIPAGTTGNNSPQSATLPTVAIIFIVVGALFVFAAILECAWRHVRQQKNRAYLREEQVGPDWTRQPIGNGPDSLARAVQREEEIEEMQPVAAMDIPEYGRDERDVRLVRIVSAKREQHIGGDGDVEGTQPPPYSAAPDLEH